MTSLCSSTRTYDGRVDSSLQLVESLVNVDPQRLGPVLAVVVLAIPGPTAHWQSTYFHILYRSIILRVLGYVITHENQNIEIQPWA